MSMEYILITMLVLTGIKVLIKPLKRYSEKNNELLGRVARWLVID